MAILFLIAAVLVSGCANGYRPAVGVRETMKEPLHASSGIGVAIWKIPVISVAGWGLPPYYFGGGLPVIEHIYNYQATPPPVAPGGVPAQPPGPPAPVGYQTTYPPAPFDDATLLVLKNVSYRATLWASVDGGKEILLLPGQITADIRVDVGDHTVRYRGEVLTGLGPRPIPERIIPFRVEARGQPHIYPLSEY